MKKFSVSASAIGLLITTILTAIFSTEFAQTQTSAYRSVGMKFRKYFVLFAIGAFSLVTSTTNCKNLNTENNFKSEIRQAMALHG